MNRNAGAHRNHYPSFTALPRLTKVHATLGPASSDRETIRRMVEAGMGGCRLNMSHSSHDAAGRVLDTVRRVSHEMDVPIAVGADLRGPKLRIGDVAGGSIQLVEGERFDLVRGDSPADDGAASVDYPHLAEDLRPGDPVLLNDGALALRVEKLENDRVLCRVEKGGPLTSRKGVNLPGIPLRVPSLTPKDVEDIAFAAEAEVDFLYLSYARSREQILAVRAELSRWGADLPIVAKVERQEGVDALQEIIEAADGVCVARGDLGIEIPLGSAPAVQSVAARMCREAGKFAMMGGQVLAGMVSSPTPLRAEVADLAAVVGDGMDALVLSDETAAGRYPVEAVRVASTVLARAEQGSQDSSHVGGALGGALGPVVVLGDSEAARALSASRQAYPIVAVVRDPQTANWLSSWWGIVPVLAPDGTDLQTAARSALERLFAGSQLPHRVLTIS